MKAQDGAPLKLQRTKFPKYAKDIILKLLSISQCQKNTPRDTHKTRKPLFSPTGNMKNPFLKINFLNYFWENLRAEKGAFIKLKSAMKTRVMKTL